MVFNNTAFTTFYFKFYSAAISILYLLKISAKERIVATPDPSSFAPGDPPSVS